MFGFKKFNEQTHKEELEKTANAAMFFCYSLLKDSTDKPPFIYQSDSGTVIAGASNWIFRFGDYGPKFTAIPSARREIDEALRNFGAIARSDCDLVEITAGVIAGAAAQDVPIDTFKTHFDRLLLLNLVKTRINIPSLEKLLSKSSKYLPYYYYMQYGE